MEIVEIVAAAVDCFLTRFFFVGFPFSYLIVRCMMNLLDCKYLSRSAHVRSLFPSSRKGWKKRRRRGISEESMRYVAIVGQDRFFLFFFVLFFLSSLF